jgi:predicted outer membrane repeat protein
MWSTSVFRFWKSRSRPTGCSKPASRCRHSFRPCLEGLEDRCVPSTLRVTSNADNGAAGTLRWAVQQAKNHDTIEIDTTQTIVLTQGQIVISVGQNFLPQNLTIEAATNTTATVSGGFTSRIFEVEASVTLNNLDLINGRTSGYGGAVVDNVANLTVNNCSFSGNSARSGGAIYDFGGNLTVNNCAFSGNTANDPTFAFGGAIYVTPANPLPPGVQGLYPILSINNSTFSGNTATDGGAIFDSAFPTSFKNPQMAISGCSFSGNSATNGGAVYLDPNGGNEYVTISNSSFVNNTATQQGGAIWVQTGRLPVTVTQDTFSGNTPNNIFGPYTDGGGNKGL